MLYLQIWRDTLGAEYSTWASHWKTLSNCSSQCLWRPDDWDNHEVRSKVQLRWRKNKLLHVSYQMLLMKAGRTEQAPADAFWRGYQSTTNGILPPPHPATPPLPHQATVVSFGLVGYSSLILWIRKGWKKRKTTVFLPGAFASALRWFWGRDNESDQGTWKLQVRGNLLTEQYESSSSSSCKCSCRNAAK